MLGRGSWARQLHQEESPPSFSWIWLCKEWSKDYFEITVKKEAVVTRGRKKTMSMAGKLGRCCWDVGELGGQLGWEVASGTQVSQLWPAGLYKTKKYEERGKTETRFMGKWVPNIFPQLPSQDQQQSCLFLPGYTPFNSKNSHEANFTRIEILIEGNLRQERV